MLTGNVGRFGLHMGLPLGRFFWPVRSRSPLRKCGHLQGEQQQKQQPVCPHGSHARTSPTPLGRVLSRLYQFCG